MFSKFKGVNGQIWIACHTETIVFADHVQAQEQKQQSIVI